MPPSVYIPGRQYMELLLTDCVCNGCFSAARGGSSGGLIPYCPLTSRVTLASASVCQTRCKKQRTKKHQRSRRSLHEERQILTGLGSLTLDIYLPTNKNYLFIWNKRHLFHSRHTNQNNDEKYFELYLNHVFIFSFNG